MMRICIADDDASIRESLRFLFEENEAVVEEARDGVELLALLQSVPQPRVVLLDRMMPRLDGYGVLDALTRQPAVCACTAILFMTARGDPPDVPQRVLVEQMTVGSVRKPFAVTEMETSVTAAWVRLIEQGRENGHALTTP